jgi:hydroxypyruvate isomerase
MSSISRRKMLKSTLAGTALASGVPMTSSISWGQEKPSASRETPMPRKGNIRQSVSRWCYAKMSLDELCAYSAQIGLKGVDLLEPQDFETPKKYGLICTMGYANAGTIPDALNVVANHDKIEAGLRQNIPLAAKAGVPNVITFSGNRRGVSDEEGAKNVILGLNRVKKIAEDNNVVLNLELLNSKVNHKDYMADHTAWGVGVMKEVNSTHVKLLYDIYHMQIMEGDLIATIKENIQWLGHFHTGGVPGRHELNNTQEVQWDGVMRGIMETGYKGYVAHEFVPTGDPKTSLLQAVDLCDV